MLRQDNENTTYLVSITMNCKTISNKAISTNRRPHACRKQRHLSGRGSSAWAPTVPPDDCAATQDCLPLSAAT